MGRPAGNDLLPVAGVSEREAAAYCNRHHNGAAAADPSADPRAQAVFDTPPLLLRKVLGFRAVPPLGEGCGCRH